MHTSAWRFYAELHGGPLGSGGRVAKTRILREIARPFASRRAQVRAVLSSSVVVLVTALSPSPALVGWRARCQLNISEPPFQITTRSGLLSASWSRETVSAGAGCPSLALNGSTPGFARRPPTLPAPMVPVAPRDVEKLAALPVTSCAYIVSRCSRGAGVQSVALQSTEDPTVIIAVVDCDQRLASGEELAAATNRCRLSDRDNRRHLRFE